MSHGSLPLRPNLWIHSIQYPHMMQGNIKTHKVCLIIRYIDHKYRVAKMQWMIVKWMVFEIAFFSFGSDFDFAAIEETLAQAWTRNKRVFTWNSVFYRVERFSHGNCLHTIIQTFILHRQWWHAAASCGQWRPTCLGQQRVSQHSGLSQSALPYGTPPQGADTQSWGTLEKLHR